MLNQSRTNGLDVTGHSHVQGMIALEGDTLPRCISNQRTGHIAQNASPNPALFFCDGSAWREIQLK